MKRITMGSDSMARNYREKYGDFLKQIGATTIETYVKWSDFEGEPNEIDFSLFDRQLRNIEKYGLKWQPFIICGPWYSVPYWFKNSKENCYFRCLEHNIDSGIQSIWNASFEKIVKRFLGLFYEHYKDRTELIDSILLGISGDYGEAIYPVIGNWEGLYHTHEGFWCNDKFAVLDFQRYLKKKFKSINVLNRQWETSYSDFHEIKPFLKKDAPSRRAMIDMVYWYRQSMLGWAEFWVKETKKLWDKKDIYLCMGGDGSAEAGQHYTEAARLCSKYKVGIRDTNARDNFQYLNTYQCHTAVATNYYNSYCGFESSSGSDEKLIVARLFAFIISQAKEFHEYSYSFHNRKDVIKNFCKYRELMEIEFERKVEIAVFSSEAYVNWIHERAISWKIKNLSWGLPTKLHNLFYGLRNYFDFDLVNDSLIRNNILKNYKVFIIPGFTIIEDDIIKIIYQRINNGQKTIIYGENELEDIKGRRINFTNVENIGSKKKLLELIKELEINVKTRKDGIFEVLDKNGNILCYDENKDLIYRKVGKNE